jgi:peptidase E
MKKKIFVMGGGGFTRDQDLKLEKFLLSLSDVKNPKIAFLPQASNESRDYILKFYQSFLSLGAQPSWVSLFGRVEPGWKELLLSQDIIYVGGGNTRSMLALWREWGVDQVLRQAYDKGIILSGLSAGMLCWFQEGITDSVWPLGVVQGLNLIETSACPHFDTETERQSFYSNSVANGSVIPGYALYDDTGALFVDGEFLKAVKTKAGKKAKFIDRDGIKVLETELL